MPVFDKKTLFRLFLVVFGGIVLYWLLHDTDRVKAFFGIVSGVIAPFVFGGVLAFVLNVPMRAIENCVFKQVKKPVIKRVLAVILTFLALVLVVTLVFWLLIPQVIDTVNSLIAALPDFSVKMQNAFSDFLSDKPKMLEWIKTYTNFTGWTAMAEKALGVLGNNLSAIFNGAVSAIGDVFSGVFNAVIGIVFSVYCLFQKETLARQCRKLLYTFTKEKTADRIISVMRLTNSTFSNFLSGQCVEVCILGGMYAIAMTIFRMPYIPLITVVIAITAFIPIVGAWTGCIVGTFLIFVKDPMLALVFVVMFLVIQLIENNMIYPRVVGNSVGLSGMWVLIAITIGGELMGILGMFLMIPAVSVLYTLLREYANKKLALSGISNEKLQPQPPEPASKPKEKNVRCKKNKKTDAPQDKTDNNDVK